jgi:hypothetical protein
MSTNTRRMQATPEQVWDVLADGWLYPLWVVGASRMRDVDDEWPVIGARLHHSIGTWPLLPGSMLTLHARAWPTGTAGVTLRLDAVGGETDVTIEEDAVAGPGRLVPKPLRDVPLAWRNVESLRRLAYIVERRRAS